jgi:FkbM family methyltransferase
MKPAICVDRLSKLYRLDDMEKRRSRTLGETIMGALAAPWDRLRRSLDKAIHGEADTEADIFWALKDVSFEVQPGEVVAVIGPNGAGKSTLFKILSRITKPTKGNIELRGRLGSLLEVGTGFHPELTGRENVFLNAAILGMSRREIDRKFDEIVDFADIDQFIDMPVKRYSSGMYVRLAFAVAAHLEPDILLLDEVLAVGDAEFAKKSGRRIHDLTRQGITTLIVSHGPQMLEGIAHRCLYIRSGALAFDGSLAEAVKRYNADLLHDMSIAESAPQELNGDSSGAADSLSSAIPATATDLIDEAEPISFELSGQHHLDPDIQNGIISVSASNAEGLAAIGLGEALYITVRYRSRPSFPQVHFQVTIWTKQETILVCADTRQEHQPEFASSEEGTAVCVFPSIPLKPGRYLVRVAMLNSESPWGFIGTFGWGNDPRSCSFLIKPQTRLDESAQGSPNHSDYGLFRLPFEWCRGEDISGSEQPETAPMPLDDVESPPADGDRCEVSTSEEISEGSSEGRVEIAPAESPVNIAVSSQQPVNIALSFTGDARGVHISVNSSQGTEPSNGSECCSSSTIGTGDAADFLGLHPREVLVAKEPNSVIKFLNYEVEITGGAEFYIQYKNLFLNRNYHFESNRRDPLIIDGGSNIGMAILYFKHVYPEARIIGFEPDPMIFRILQNNMERNNLSDVELVNAGLWPEAGTMGFLPDLHDGGRFHSCGPHIVAAKLLSDYLDDPVDFVKLNIEGGEFAVLQEIEASGKIKQIGQMVLEYHCWPNEQQRLGPVLDLLSRQGFRYLVHDFDFETNAATKPPFHWQSDTAWCCLVYAAQLDT